jgi:hypothetical protein
MADVSRVRQLLDELLDSGCNPEVVHGDCPSCSRRFASAGSGLAPSTLSSTLNQFVLAVIHRRMGHAERAAALREDSIRLYEQMESGRVDAAVRSVFAADSMTIQIYHRELESLFMDSSPKMVKGIREGRPQGPVPRYLGRYPDAHFRNPQIDLGAWWPPPRASPRRRVHVVPFVGNSLASFPVIRLKRGGRSSCHGNILVA